MDSTRVTSAARTASIVSKAVLTGASLCIPGAREDRVDQSVSRVAGAVRRALPAAGTAADLERREYEIAGGGAPGERGTTKRANVIERLSRLLHWPPRGHHDTPLPDTATLVSPSPRPR